MANPVDISYFRQDNNCGFGPRLYSANLWAEPNGSTSQLANTLYAAPFYVGSKITIDKLFQQKVSGLTGNCRVGIYSAGDVGDTTSGTYPKALLLDAGIIAIGAPAQLYSITLGSPFTIGPNQLIYLSTVSDSLLGAMSAIGIPAGSNMLGIDFNLNFRPNGWHVAQAYGALPSTFPAGGVYDTFPIEVSFSPQTITVTV